MLKRAMNCWEKIFGQRKSRFSAKDAAETEWAWRKSIKQRKELERMHALAAKYGGKVMHDNGKAIVHINAFTYIDADGTVIHETP
jgi:hypothetical protein